MQPNALVLGGALQSGSLSVAGTDHLRRGEAEKSSLPACGTLSQSGPVWPQWVLADGGQPLGASRGTGGHKENAFSSLLSLRIVEEGPGAAKHRPHCATLPKNWPQTPSPFPSAWLSYASVSMATWCH